MRVHGILALLLLWPAASRGQAIPGTDKPQTPPSPPPVAAPPVPAQPAAEQVIIRADRQGGEKGHYFFEGFVDLRKGDMQLQADRMDVYEMEEPGGGQTRKVVAEGNVVFARGDERLSGARLSMDVDTGKGTFEDASGYIQPGVFIEAKIIERVDPNTYQVEGGKFTACGQPNPRWGFAASSARVQVNDKIVATNARFEVKDVPILYFPYFTYPIKEDNRATGFLIPHFSTSSVKGKNYGDAFFWAMGRSFDQTFYFDHYQLFDEGYGHEFRYVLDPPSRGIFREYAIKPGPGMPWDWDINWQGTQMLPFGIKSSYLVRRYSNLLFQRQIQENLNLATTRTERGILNLQRTIAGTYLNLVADSTNTYFTSTNGTTSRKNRHVPSLNVSRAPQKIGPFTLGFDTRAESLELGNQRALTRYSRFDVSPTVGLPFAVSFLQITPRARFDYTHYGDTTDPNSLRFVGSPLDRRFFEGTVAVVGPTFARVFNNPSGAYSEKFKHTIGPEINYTYRSRVDNFEVIPKFDGIDNFLGTDQIDYAIVQHFFAKRPSAAGAKPQAYEFLTWRVGQTYYVQIANNQNNFDPNYSASAFGPGGIPSHNSPVKSQLTIRPTAQITGNATLEYDVNFNQIRTLSTSAQVAGSFGSISAGYSSAEKLAVIPSGRTPSLQTVRGVATLSVIPQTLSLDSSVVYDILNSNLIQIGEKLKYEIQCCGFLVEYLRYDINGSSDHLIRFSIQLANIGGFGTFFGQDPSKVYPGLLSYR